MIVLSVAFQASLNLIVLLFAVAVSMRNQVRQAKRQDDLTYTSGAGPECFWPVGQEPDIFNPKDNADGTANEIDYQDAFQLIRSGTGD